MSNRTKSTVEVAKMGTFWVACDTLFGISVIGHSAADAFRAVSEAVAARLDSEFPEESMTAVA
jgi:hypothetical protein